MLSDIQIAQKSHPKPIEEIARGLGIKKTQLTPYGWDKAKVSLDVLKQATKQKKQKGKVVLVTAINPTPLGEGKTTTAIGLADALKRQKVKVALALREPSLGPVFGIKGGAAGGGYAQVVPMEDINLHFTGDFHAIGAANNLLAAMLDNHIKQGNALDIDPKRITWKRCVDMNDRQLRHVVDGLGSAADGVVREDGFDITVASEVMAVLCLATSIADLKKRLARIVVAYSKKGKPVTAADLKAQGAMAALLKDAIQPNLVQTLEHTPAFVHGGPFANIAHGCNSVLATKMAQATADVVVTEAGFGADLGAEKFLDITCREGGFKADAVVVVATIRALKYNGGAKKENLTKKNLAALEAGLPNLLTHVQNMTQIYGLPCVVAINQFPADTKEEIQTVRNACKKAGAQVCLSQVWEKGGRGGTALAKEVIRLLDTENAPKKYAYAKGINVKDAACAIAQKIYHAKTVEFSPAALKQLAQIEKAGYGDLLVCMAKTQYSLTDDPTKLGAPKNFTMTIREAKLAAGAGFVVMLTGSIMTMPGLPAHPAAENIDVSGTGNITGLF